MLHRTVSMRSWRGRLIPLVAILSVCFLVGSQLDADEASERIGRHLQAGEFGPALKWVEENTEGSNRDLWLQKIASRQLASGARSAGYATAYRISNDRVRTDTLNSMAFNDRAASKHAGGARGGGTIADFTQLIDLITSTVEPDSWNQAGGEGAIMEFATGVVVDASGLMRRNPPTGTDDDLRGIRTKSQDDNGRQSVRTASNLRKVSLTKLERHLQVLQAMGRQPTDAMRHLAGLQKIKYVFVYPDTRDVVIAGPAGEWRRNVEGRVVNVDSGRPVLQLDDLVVLLRNSFSETNGRFGCAIVPRQENLASAKEYLDRTAATPLKAGQRDRWLTEIRDRLGRQDIEIRGVDPRTRVAQVITEADYHMKRIGMGLEEGTAGVASYLDTLAESPDANQSFNVLRWWFTLNYDSIRATPERDAFELRGSGVKVLSENELLTERGERVHTGQADELTSRFAQSFTKQIGPLATKYPIYADLQNVFDLAVVAALLRAEDIPGQVAWTLPHFGTDGDFAVHLGVAPKEVESIINHRIVRKNEIVAGVSGGVSVDARGLVAREAIRSDNYGILQGARDTKTPSEQALEVWWWD